MAVEMVPAITAAVILEPTAAAVAPAALVKGFLNWSHRCLGLGRLALKKMVKQPQRLSAGAVIGYRPNDTRTDLPGQL